MPIPRMEPMAWFYLGLDKPPLQHWSAQAAVRLSMALDKMGLYDSDSYRRAGYKTLRCAPSNAALVNDYATEPDQLYRWLRSSSPLGPVQRIRCRDVADLPGQHGIVYLRNCHTRQDPQGGVSRHDHIDFLVWIPREAPDSVMLRIARSRVHEPETATPIVLSSLLWPNEVSRSLLYGCRDGHVRFWPCEW